MKKGQLLSQPFVVIFSLVVIGLILFFGFRAIVGLLEVGEDVATKKFEQDLKNSVNDIYSQPLGSNTEITLQVPSAVKGVCLADVTRSIDTTNVPYNDVREEIDILSDVRSRNNVYFSSKENGVFIDSLEIERLKPRTVVCDDTLDGRFQVVLESRGTFVDASPA